MKDKDFKIIHDWHLEFKGTDPYGNKVCDIKDSEKPAIDEYPELYDNGNMVVFWCGMALLLVSVIIWKIVC